MLVQDGATVATCSSEKEKVPLLEMKNITKEFPGVIALNQVNLVVEQGEVHLLLGENGAGKSTMIKTIIGINKPEGGEMYWKGKRYEINNIQEAYDLGIAVIYQELSNIPCLSIVENMFLGREIIKNGLIDWKEQARKTKAALERVNLLNIDINEPMEKLGVGQRQLCEIARAIDMKAELIIMDEPTSSLSGGEINFLLDLIMELNKEGIAILFITHKLDEGKKIGDMVTVLKDGTNSGVPRQVCDVTEDDIIKMMVGRDLEEKYPERNAEIGEEVFRVEDLSSEKFRDINFGVKKGEVLGIFGLVGAGRTEVVRTIFGADPLAEGTIYVDGEVVKINTPQDAIKHGIALLTEDRKEEGLTLIHDVVENATIVTLKTFKNKFGLIDYKKREEKVTELGGFLNLRPLHIYKAASNFSGGNQQKIVVMKWLGTNSKVYIFDEPTKGVDVGAKVEIYSIMNQLAEQGAAVIMVSSEIEEIMGMSDRIMTMYEGERTGCISNDESVTEEQILLMATGGKNTND